jgi:peptidoglycan/LPS O-acetylase OafA/YrhL
MQALGRMDVAAISRRRLLQAFWVRRIFRIYPLAIFFLPMATVFHLPPFPGWATPNRGRKGIVANLLLVQNFAGSDSILAPMWSLPIEVET